MNKKPARAPTTAKEDQSFTTMRARIDRLESLLDRIQRVKREKVYIGATSGRPMSTEEPGGRWMDAETIHAILAERFK